MSSGGFLSRLLLCSSLLLTTLKFMQKTSFLVCFLFENSTAIHPVTKKICFSECPHRFRPISWPVWQSEGQVPTTLYFSCTPSARRALWATRAKAPFPWTQEKSLAPQWMSEINPFLFSNGPFDGLGHVAWKCIVAMKPESKNCNLQGLNVIQDSRLSELSLGAVACSSSFELCPWHQQNAQNFSLDTFSRTLHVEEHTMRTAETW